MNFIVQFIRQVFKLLEAKPPRYPAWANMAIREKSLPLHPLFREVHFLYHRFHFVSGYKTLAGNPAQLWRLVRKGNEDLNRIISLSFYTLCLWGLPSWIWKGSSVTQQHCPSENPHAWKERRRLPLQEVRRWRHLAVLHTSCSRHGSWICSWKWL